MRSADFSVPTRSSRGCRSRSAGRFRSCRSSSASSSWGNGCRCRSARPATRRVSADADQLEQLLINLVRNAVDASLETGGQVSIGWTASGNDLLFWIEDDGSGLPDTSNLFVPFFTTKPTGSGIGLALSRTAYHEVTKAHEAHEERICPERFFVPFVTS